jgi:hypothetical protein
VQSIDPVTLRRFHDNDTDLVARMLFYPKPARRNRFSLDWSDSWELITTPRHKATDGSTVVRVEFADPVPIHRTRLISGGTPDIS